MSNITMSSTDPGEGSPLAADEYVAVYGDTSLLDLFYPVGSFYKTADLTFDPNISWGGVWQVDNDYVLCAYAKVDGSTLAEGKNISAISSSSTGQFNITLSKSMEDVDGIIEVSGEVPGRGSEIIGAYWTGTSGIIVDFSDYTGAHVTPNNWFINIYGRLATPEYKTWKRTA